MNILLTDEEIKQAIVEADKEIWAFKVHPSWEGEKYLMKAQLKKVGEWGEERCPHSRGIDYPIPAHLRKRHCDKCWQALLKECDE